MEENTECDFLVNNLDFVQSDSDQDLARDK